MTLWKEPEANCQGFHLLTTNSCLSMAPCEQMKVNGKNRKGWNNGGSGWAESMLNKWPGFLSKPACDERFSGLLDAVKWPRHSWYLSPAITSASRSNKDLCVCRHQLALISVINCLLTFGKHYELYSNLFSENGPIVIKYSDLSPPPLLIQALFTHGANVPLIHFASLPVTTGTPEWVPELDS